MKCGEMSKNRFGWLHLATRKIADTLNISGIRGPPSLRPFIN